MLFLGIFAYFKLIYFWISRTKSSIKEGGGDIFSKVPEWKHLVLLKIKVKRIPVCPNKEYNVIFKQINQKVSCYLRGKEKIALINDW